MGKIVRIARAPKGRKTDAFTIFNLELPESEVEKLGLVIESGLFHDSEVEELLPELPPGQFHEVMYKNAIVDPQFKTIGDVFESLGVQLEGLKVSTRYYGDAFKGVYVNPNVEQAFVEEPKLTTLKPRGVRLPMDSFNLIPLNDAELMHLSLGLELSLSLEQMQKIRRDQVALGLPFMSDVLLDVYATLWCDHCKHTRWEALENLLEQLRQTTAEINNPNVISAFVDNAGVFDFYDGYVIVIGAETHNSPTRKWPFGGQITKIVGHQRDPFQTGGGAKLIGHMEMTTVGEFQRKVYPVLEKYVCSEQEVARETIAAISKGANTMGIPMLLARMYSHPAFGAKPFAWAGTIAITTKDAALKGVPKAGDLAVLAGGKTGNDGYKGGRIASLKMDKTIDAGDSTHVQIGDPFTQQKFMRAIPEIRDAKCTRARNDLGAGGLTAFIEMAAPQKYRWASYEGGLLLNLALPPLKCAALPYKVIAVGESQERFAFAVIPEKLDDLAAIFDKYEIEWTVIGVFTGNGKLQIMYDENIREFTKDTQLSGEKLVDHPYNCFEDCPIPPVKVIEPPPKNTAVVFPEITLQNVEDMAEKVVGDFNNCCQKVAQAQYDSTVQGISVQGPLYGVNYNVGSHLAVQKPIYGKPYGVTSTMRFSPWIFDADPVAGAFSCMLDAYITQVAAGVNPRDVVFVDNFYSPNLNPYAPWYVIQQVKTICEQSRLTGPYINGKDSNYGSCEYEGIVINIPPCLNVMTGGKIPDVKQLILHQWQRPGNLLFSLGKRSKSLAGSTLASALGISDGAVEAIPIDGVGRYVRNISWLASSQLCCSFAPVNTGGLILRLFEGVEASGFGVETDLCEELFPENFGTVLVEVDPRDKYVIWYMFGSDAFYVGTITEEKGITVRGKRLNWDRLYESWSTKFQREVYNVR